MARRILSFSLILVAAGTALVIAWRARAASMIMIMDAGNIGIPFQEGLRFLAGDAQEAPISAEYPADWKLIRETRGRNQPWLDRSASITAAAVRALAERHPSPDRVELWDWWRQVSSHDSLEPGYLGFRSSTRPEPPDPEADLARMEADRARREAYDAAVDYLRASDPGNGWPLALATAAMLGQSVDGTLVHDPDPDHPADSGRTKTRVVYEVTDPEQAAAAVKLLHEAVRKPVFDDAADGLALADWTRLGGKPRTLQESIRHISIQAGMSFPDLQKLRQIAQRASAEAGRRAGMDDADLPDALSAETVFHDVQTLGARLMVSSPTLVGQLAGVAIQDIASKEGDQALRHAGQEAAARKLAERGRRIARLNTLAHAVGRIREQREIEAGTRPRPMNPRPTGFLADDPDLLAEAAAIVDREGSRPAMDDCLREQPPGILGGLLYPARQRSIYAPDIFPKGEELRAGARFEFYGFARMAVACLLAALSVLLLAMLAAHGFNRLVFRRRDDNPDGPAGFPKPGWVALASAAFALPAAVATLILPVFPGSMFQIGIWPYLRVDAWKGAAGYGAAWALSWIIWGHLLAWNLLISLAKRSAESALPAAAPPRRLAPRIVWGGLAAAALLYLLQLAAMLKNGIPWSAEDEIMIIAFAALMVPAAINSLFHASGVLVNPSAAARARSRRLLTGIAGGLLLWCGVYYWAAEREIHWAERETLMTPNLINGRATIFSPLETRVVNRCRDYVEGILAEEANTITAR